MREIGGESAIERMLPLEMYTHCTPKTGKMGWVGGRESLDTITNVVMIPSAEAWRNSFGDKKTNEKGQKSWQALPVRQSAEWGSTP